MVIPPERGRCRMTVLLPMQVFTHVLLFLIGLLTGSFLNVVIYRLPRKKSLISPRSSCVHCNTILQVPDLFPLVSFIFLQGRCRYCGGRIPWRYPLVELLTALIFLFCFVSFEFSPFFYNYVVFFSLLLIISFIDVDEGIIPNRLVLILLVWSISWQLLYADISLMAAIAGLVAGGGLFFLIAVLSKGGMGGGDIKLMAVLGFAIGSPLVFVVFLLAFLLGAAVGAALLLTGKKTRRDPLPFAPFLSLSFFISVFWGRQIWSWYQLYM